jgi:hypothetical protein
VIGVHQRRLQGEWHPGIPPTLDEQQARKALRPALASEQQNESSTTSPGKRMTQAATTSPAGAKAKQGRCRHTVTQNREMHGGEPLPTCRLQQKNCSSTGVQHEATKRSANAPSNTHPPRQPGHQPRRGSVDEYLYTLQEVFLSHVQSKESSSLSIFC